MRKLITLTMLFSCLFCLSADMDDKVLNLISREKKAFTTRDFEKLIKDYQNFIKKNDSELSSELKESLLFSMASVYEKKLMNPHKAIEIYLQLVEKNPDEKTAERIFPNFRRCLLLIPQNERKQVLMKSSVFSGIEEQTNQTQEKCVQYDPKKIDDSMFEDVSEEEIIRREKEAEKNSKGHVPPIQPSLLDTPEGFVEEFYSRNFKVEKGILGNINSSFQIIYPETGKNLQGEFLASPDKFFIKLPQFSIHFFDGEEHLYLNGIKSNVPIQYSSTKSQKEFLLLKEKLLFLLGLRNPGQMFYLDYGVSTDDLQIIEAYEKGRKTVYQVFYRYYFQKNPEKLLKCEIIRFSDKKVLFQAEFSELKVENEISRSRFIYPAFSRKTRNIPNSFRGL